MLYQITGDSPRRLLLLLRFREPWRVCFSQWTTLVLVVMRNPQTTKVAGSHLCCLASSEVNRKIFPCFFSLPLYSLLRGCSKASSTASQCNKISIQKVCFNLPSFFQEAVLKWYWDSICTVSRSFLVLKACCCCCWWNYSQLVFH